MQQAYRALRVVAEAQTIRMVLTPHPGELMLKELSSACATLDTESSNGIKAVVLDFTSVSAAAGSEGAALAQSTIDRANVAVHAIPQPVLTVVRSTPSAAACVLMRAADLTLVAHDAVLTIPPANDTLAGIQAARLGYVTWSVPAQDVSKEMERILDLLRGKSAIALRNAKASIRLGQAKHTTPLEALNKVNALYLTRVIQTTDASEGLRAFLEKRQPKWKNS